MAVKVQTDIYGPHIRQIDIYGPHINGLSMQLTKSAGKIKIKKSAENKQIPNRQRCISIFAGLAERVVLVLCKQRWVYSK